MSINYELIKTDTLTRGFHVLYEPDGVNFINPDEFKLLNTEERSRDNGVLDVPHALSERLTALGTVFKTTYIDFIWPQAIHHKFIIWEGIDNDNKGWHTDMFEGYDVFFLYYLDDTFPESGGEIQFKWKKEDNVYTETVQPKKGTLILVNNCRGFWHRAKTSSIKRRVVSFDYTVGLQNAR